MKHVFWLRDGQLAGRSGPNKHPWHIETFKTQGFSAILSVNDGEGAHETLIRQHGLNYAHIPMSDNAPPRPGDKQYCLSQLPLAISFITDHLTGGPVLVHCRSGKDRTAMVMAATLMMMERISAQAAMDDIISVRPIAFTAEGWADFAQDVLTEFEKQQFTTS
ncbi:protein-tyrosine phosphatase family protein [Gynuella sp.]|uniref:protein-tyrosine phosphatase family protein n=1 Tax=Gynuella sp. TaxID=2969146 RepID=UPI003D0A4EF5